MKTIKVKCEKCEKEFDKLIKEIKRCKKQGMNINFCSRSCSGSFRNAMMTKEYWMKQYEKQKKTFDIKSVAGLGRKRNEYSPFRIFINKCKCRKKDFGIEFNITLEYLKKLWEYQNGTCSYTGIKMILPETTNLYNNIHSLKKASIDRIDSSKGYIEGNVEFVCLAVNYAKCNFTKEETISFFKEIVST